LWVQAPHFDRGLRIFAYLETNVGTNSSQLAAYIDIVCVFM
jgi:hypothetical protein